MNYKYIFKSKKLRSKLLGFLDFLPDKAMIIVQYFIKFGRLVDLSHPERFSEKIQWYKLYYRDELMTECADKLKVREYVASQGLEDLLIPIYRSFHCPDEICLDNLPSKYVIKYNNGAQRNIICYNSDFFDVKEAESQIRYWFRNPLNKMGREWSYYNVKPGVVVEKFIEPEPHDGLIDYKFFCFNGEPTFLYVTKDRFTNKGLTLGIFDINFDKMNVFREDISPLLEELEKPKHFDDMVRAARILAKPFPHVRVDLYNIGGRIYFGELTFYDGSGYAGFLPDAFDYEVGEMFSLPQKK